MKVVVIPPSGPVRVESIEPSDSAWLHETVGGYFEVVGIPRGLMWLNEEGKLRGLPINGRASSLYPDIIVGTVVVTGPADADGNFTEVDERYLPEAGR